MHPNIYANSNLVSDPKGQQMQEVSLSNSILFPEEITTVPHGDFDNVALRAWFLNDACASYFIYAPLKFLLLII